MSTAHRATNPLTPGGWVTARRVVGRLIAMWTLPLQLFVFTRIAYMLMSLIGLKLVPQLYLHEAGRQKFLEPYPLVDGLCRWDCGWFVNIVNDGYKSIEYAKVFPLFPLIGWVVQRLTGIHHLITFLVVANAASLASYYVIYRLFADLSDEPAARWGLVAFAAYPFAYYQACAYPESAMVLASAMALALARRRHHLLAGLVLGLGVMARHLTLFGGAGLVGAQIRQRGIRPRRLLLDVSILGLAIPWAFIAAFSYYLARRFHDPLAVVNSRSMNFGPEVWYGVRQVFLYIPYDSRPEYYYYIAFSVIPLTGVVACCTRRAWAEVALDGAVLMAVVLGSGAAGMGRYSASCWPAFLPIGVWLAKRQSVAGPFIVMLALFQGLFFFLFSHQWPVL